MAHIAKILSQTLFADRILDNRYINPMGRVTKGIDYTPSKGGGDGKYMSMHLWQHTVITSSATKIRIVSLAINWTGIIYTTSQMLQLAKAIQYLHSMDVVLDCEFHSVCSHVSSIL